MCKRSEKPFPTSCDDFIGFFENAWNKGWLDEYSDVHFLIKCINYTIKKQQSHGNNVIVA